jgi:hypothetical protein
MSASRSRARIVIPPRVVSKSRDEAHHDVRPAQERRAGRTSDPCCSIAENTLAGDVPVCPAGPGFKPRIKAALSIDYNGAS